MAYVCPQVCTGFLLMLLFLAFGLFFCLLLSHLWSGWYQQVLWPLLRLGEIGGFP